MEFLADFVFILPSSVQSWEGAVLVGGGGPSISSQWVHLFWRLPSAALDWAVLLGKCDLSNRHNPFETARWYLVGVHLIALNTVAFSC